jgi:hypothetical protein
MASLKKKIIADLCEVYIPDMVAEYFAKIKKPTKRVTTTSFRLWSSENRSRFEICEKCQVPYAVNSNKKKTCPECDAKYDATMVLKRIGAAWREVPKDIKETYANKARELNQKK